MRAGMEMAMIRSFVYGVLNTNAYLVWQGADAVLVDPPDDTAAAIAARRASSDCRGIISVKPI